LAYRDSVTDHSVARNVLALVMLKRKPDFERPPRISLNVREEERAREAPIAMADYIKARQTLLARMIELRANRLSKLQGNSNGEQ
jgi:hypothetical protein